MKPDPDVEKIRKRHGDTPQDPLPFDPIPQSVRDDAKLMDEAAALANRGEGNAAFHRLLHPRGCGVADCAKCGGGR